MADELQVLFGDFLLPTGEEPTGPTTATVYTRLDPPVTVYTRIV